MKTTEPLNLKEKYISRAISIACKCAASRENISKINDAVISSVWGEIRTVISRLEAAMQVLQTAEDDSFRKPKLTDLSASKIDEFMDSVLQLKMQSLDFSNVYDLMNEYVFEREYKESGRSEIREADYFLTSGKNNPDDYDFIETFLTSKLIISSIPLIIYWLGNQKELNKG